MFQHWLCCVLLFCSINTICQMWEMPSLFRGSVWNGLKEGAKQRARICCRGSETGFCTETSPSPQEGERLKQEQKLSKYVNDFHLGVIYSVVIVIFILASYCYIFSPFFSDICLSRQVCCWPVLCKKGVSSCSIQSLQAHLQQHPCWESTAGGGGETALSNTSWSVLLLFVDTCLYM